MLSSSRVFPVGTPCWETGCAGTMVWKAQLRQLFVIAIPSWFLCRMHKNAPCKQIWEQNTWLVTRIVLSMPSCGLRLGRLPCFSGARFDTTSLICCCGAKARHWDERICFSRWCLIFYDPSRLVPPQVGGTNANERGSVFWLPRAHVRSVFR